MQSISTNHDDLAPLMPPAFLFSLSSPCLFLVRPQLLTIMQMRVFLDYEKRLYGYERGLPRS